jgi:hypothetical protein
VSVTDEGSGLIDLTARIYADRDFSPGGREVALALAWSLRQGTGRDGHWRQARDLLGHDGVYRSWRIWEATAEDLPYYDPGPWLGGGICEGPRLRPYKPKPAPERPYGGCLHSHHPHLGDCWFTVIHGSAEAYAYERGPRDQSVCGAHGTIEITEHDPVTGWETGHWFCSRHKERAREVKAQLRAALPEPPPPIPNRGGVLPRYFVTDWEKLYGTAAEKAHSRRAGMGYWKPPYHGVCRDDWPVPGKTLVPRRPRLAVVS